jgi:hypothetical protein
MHVLYGGSLDLKLVNVFEDCKFGQKDLQSDREQHNIIAARVLWHCQLQGRVGRADVLYVVAKE